MMRNLIAGLSEAGEAGWHGLGFVFGVYTFTGLCLGGLVVAFAAVVRWFT